MLPPDEEIHTFRDISVRGSVSIYASRMPRERLLQLIDRWPCYRSGTMASGMGHGLCIHDGNDPLFVQTREDTN
jgi:hypothetical protein